MSERRHPRVVNLAEAESRPWMVTGTKLGSTARRLGPLVGAQKLGCSWFEIEPGRAAFPFHWHAANEELIYVLDGEGTLRIGNDRVPVRGGDIIGMPPGPSAAHQLLNTGTAPLRYLCISTMLNVEVVGYPDSKKIGAMAAPTPGDEAWVRQMYFETDQKGYLDGEDVG